MTGGSSERYSYVVAVQLASLVHATGNINVQAVYIPGSGSVRTGSLLGSDWADHAGKLSMCPVGTTNLKL